MNLFSAESLVLWWKWIRQQLTLKNGGKNITDLIRSFFLIFFFTKHQKHPLVITYASDLNPDNEFSVDYIHGNHWLTLDTHNYHASYQYILGRASVFSMGVCTQAQSKSVFERGSLLRHKSTRYFIDLLTYRTTTTITTTTTLPVSGRQAGRLDKCIT